jgi:hypothetical protein
VPEFCLFNLSVKTAIISPDGWGLDSIRAHLRSKALAVDCEFHSLLEISENLRPGMFDLLVLRFDKLSRQTLNQIQRLRLLERRAGLVTVASQIESALRFEARSLERHILLEEPSELKDLASSLHVLFEKSDSLLIGSRRARARLHARVQRAEELTVYQSDGADKKSGYFIDFAQMGARVVLEGKHRFQERDPITVEYRSSTDRSRIHRIHSKIAWVRESGANHTQLGVRFIASL